MSGKQDYGGSLNRFYSVPAQPTDEVILIHFTVARMGCTNNDNFGLGSLQVIARLCSRLKTSDVTHLEACQDLHDDFGFKSISLNK